MSRAPLGVVMVSASFHPYVGGAEKQALELSAALRSMGVEARVVTRRLPDLPASSEVRGVPVRRLWCVGSGVLNALTFMMSLCVHLLSTSRFYDAIHVHLAGSPALAASLAGRILGKRVVVKLGGGRGIGELAESSKTLSGRLKLALLSWMRPQFVAVVEDLAQESWRYLGDVPVRVVPNGVDCAAYRPHSEVEKKALRARLGWPAGTGFLYVGRLSAEKRLPWFLEAWAEAAKGAPAFVAFVGEGPEEHKIREAVGRLGLGERFFLHPNMEDVSQAYASADVFVLPSISEGLSNALLEAMASGLCVLASRVGGTVETVKDGSTGLLFDAQDEAALKAAVRRLLSDPAIAAGMGRAAREAALSRFAMERIASEYQALYKERP